MKRPARRTIIKVLALLAAGAALNVAVAWGCGVLVGDDGYQEFLRENPRSSLPSRLEDAYIGVNRQFGRFRCCVIVTEFMSGSIRSVDSLDMETPRWWDDFVPDSALAMMDERGEGRQRVVEAMGWPLLCLSGAFDLVIDRRAAGLVVDGSIDAIVLSSTNARASVQDCRFLGLRPIWPGFVVNTLFYAGVLWLQICGPFALRRMIRRRRGQCAKCAYPIGTSEVCTECGAAVTPHVMPAKAGIQ